MDFIKKHKFLITLVALFFGQFFLISPFGEFPLNDDWVHAEMVQHWATTGEFRLNPYTGPLLYSQLIYGTALAKIFGFSFTLLRFSTLFLTGGLVVSLFLFLKKYCKNEPLAFFSTLLIWLNPIFYGLTFTFMTDVPALALMFFAIMAFYTGAEKEKSYLFWVGGVLAFIGFFIRQTNILILPAVGALWLLQKPLRKIKYLLPIIIPGLTAVFLYHWLSTNGLIGEGGSYHEIEDKKELIKHIIWWGVYTVLYTGLFLLPLLVSYTKKIKTWWYLGFGTFGTLFSTWMRLRRHETFPYVSNTINRFGLGPFSDVLSGNYLPIFPNWVWISTSLVAGFGGGLLTYVVLQWLLTKKIYFTNHSFILAFALIFVLPILYFTGFDRYFLALILTGIIFWSLQFPETKLTWFSWILLGMMAFYTLSQTHFYLNWNRARADLVSTAFNTHNSNIDTLDSGYEWTGYHDYWEAAKTPRVYRWPAGSPWWLRFLMTNNNRTEVITSSPLEGYTTLETRIVPGLNPNNQLYLQKKNDVNQ